MINKKSKIFVAGHKGMVGSAIVRKLKEKGFSKIIFAEKKKLNLLDQDKVFKYLKKKKPDLVIIAAAKVGGIQANSNFKQIFIYENLEPVNIWMYKTFIPLDIIFLKKNKITKITPNAHPCLDLPCKLYPSSEPVDMIIEINAGQAKILNLKVGDDLIFLKNRI